MKLPIKNYENIPAVPPLCFDEFDAWGGAIKEGRIYVRECKGGEIVLKSKTKPYKRGIVNNMEVFYYLVIGDEPPAVINLIASTWSRI
jgi:hypothetical protein